MDATRAELEKELERVRNLLDMTHEEVEEQTMPHLQNCDHSEDGWCLDCVKKMHDEFDLRMEIKASCRFQHNADELKAIGELLAFLEAWPESTNHADLGIEGKIEVWWTDSLMGVIEGDCESGWDYHPVAFGEKGTQEQHGKNI